MFKAIVLASCVLVSVGMGKSLHAQTGNSASTTQEQNKSSSDQDITEVTILLKRQKSAAPLFNKNRPYKSQFTSADGCGHYDAPGWLRWERGNVPPMSEYERAYIDDFTKRDRFSEAGVNGELNASSGDSSSNTETEDYEEEDTLSQCERSRLHIAKKSKSFQEAFTFYEAKAYPEALMRFKHAYDKVGYEVAALMVGDMYLKGQGTPKDVKAAMAWYRKIADRPIYRQEPFDPKNPDVMSPRVEATMMLAQIYIAGADVPRDFKAGLGWIEHASAMGYVPATKLSGDFYYKGYGTPKNLKKAVKYYQTAALLGYAPAQYAWGLILQTGEDGIKADAIKARDLYVLSAREGHPGAQYQMAIAYETGDGVTANAKTALLLYKDAALGGNADAQNAIGTWFYRGDALLPKDDVVARQWFETAARTGHSEAAFNLAVMYVKGEGGPRDLVTACLWFDIAHRAGHPNAETAKAQVMKQLTDAEKAELSKRLTATT